MFLFALLSETGQLIEAGKAAYITPWVTDTWGCQFQALLLNPRLPFI